MSHLSASSQATVTVQIAADLFDNEAKKRRLLLQENIFQRWYQTNQG
ncbi:MAG: hypothetical protein Q9M21_04110 [Mariprofundaceae bacterium]|nr:hypothetical protein [Mariprofundaceae bacterium]